MTDTDAVHEALLAAAAAVADVLSETTDWGMVDPARGQYAVDVAADDAAVAPLRAAGLGVLSEESGRHDPERDITVVLDPLDGSTNASRGIPWFATSLCAVDAEGPLAALVVDQAHGHRYTATRGVGSWRDGAAIAPREPVPLAEAIVALADVPGDHGGWAQYRALGAAALDLCAVADGTLDAYLDCGHDAHGPWDYLGGMLVCHEAGAVVVDGDGRDLVTLDHGDRRAPAAATGPGLLDEVLAVRAGWN